MVGPTFGGDPDDTGVSPVPVGLLGAFVIAVSVGLGGTLALFDAAIGDGIGAAGTWLLLAGLVLGASLIAWEKLTDFFAAAPPPGRTPDPDDEDDGLGDSLDDVGPE